MVVVIEAVATSAPKPLRVVESKFPVVLVVTTCKLSCISLSPYDP
jgi:hypothetical protein